MCNSYMINILHIKRFRIYKNSYLSFFHVIFFMMGNVKKDYTLVSISSHGIVMHIITIIIFNNLLLIHTISNIIHKYPIFLSSQRKTKANRKMGGVKRQTFSTNMFHTLINWLILCFFVFLC
jgi:hypothetical protein